MHIPIFAIILIFIALIFEFINGFHDTANAVATSIATRSLEPMQAIGIAAIFDLLGAISGTAVALTIVQGLVDPLSATNSVILAALLAAITWNLVTWYLGIPASSSHALIGGLVGAVGFSSTFHHIHWFNIFNKVLLPMVCSPILGFCLAIFVAVLLHRFFRDSEPHRVNNHIREFQVLSTAFLSFSHGSNDAQKTMGIITLILLHYHLIARAYVPDWVIILCACCMASGTLLGGMRIIKTLSGRVAKLKPASGLAAELSSALVLFVSARLGMPVSTTHAISGSIMGAGSALRGNIGVNWGVVKNIVIAWVLTFPICVVLSGLILHLIHTLRL